MRFNFEFRTWFLAFSILHFEAVMLERVIFAFGLGSLRPNARRITVRWTATDGFGGIQWQIGRNVWRFRGPIERIRSY